MQEMKEEETKLYAALQNAHQPASHTVLWTTYVAPFVPKNAKNFTIFSGIWSRLIQSPDSHFGEQEEFHIQR